MREFCVHKQKQPANMAQSDFKLKGNAVELQDAFQKKGYPVAFVGSVEDKLKIFNVLTELKLARRIRPIPDHDSKEYEEAKDKDQEGLNPNLFKDKATNYVYEVRNKPSVIISITGDAADLPEDQELNQGVKNLMGFCIKFDKDDKFPFCAEDARRALLLNYIHRKADIEKLLRAMKKEGSISVLSSAATDSKILQISYLLQVRIEDLDVNKRFEEKYSKHFKYPSVRDMLLNVNEDVYKQLTLLDNHFNFARQKEEGGRDIEPIASVKRLPKSRRV